MGGGINAITKSGTNTLKGTAYTYHRNESLRGNTVDGHDLGDRARERTETYGFTLGGPIIKNKLFFFINGEYENSPNPITKYHVSTDGVGNGATQTSRVTPRSSATSTATSPAPTPTSATAARRTTRPWPVWTGTSTTPTS